MSIKFRHGRKFPPRISREELYDRTNQRVEECGVNNHFQAQFTNNIAKEVVGLKDHKYESLQPELKLKDAPAWKDAFTVVQQYLTDFQMKITLESISIELQKQKLPVNESFLKNTNSISILSRLVDESSNLPSFIDQVDQFAKEEGIPANGLESNQNAAQKYTQKEKNKLFDIKQKKSNENPKSPNNASAKESPKVNDNFLDDDFDEVEPNIEQKSNVPPPTSPVKNNTNQQKPLSTKSNEADEKLSDHFDYSFEEDADTTNGKSITKAVFSKADFSVAVDELQSDDGKQTADNQQMLQQLMADNSQNESKQESLVQKDTNQVQEKNQNSDVVEDFSDVDVDIPLDSNSDDDFNGNQSQASDQKAISKSNPNDTKDINAEIISNDDFEVEVDNQNENSPVKQPETNQVSQDQNSLSNEFEEFDSNDDVDIDIDGDFDHDSEREKKEQPSTPKADNPPPENDFDNDLADDADLDNLPSSNNSPQKTANTANNNDSAIENDFDDFEVDDEDLNIDVVESPKAEDVKQQNPEPSDDSNVEIMYDDMGEDIEVDDNDENSKGKESNSISNGPGDEADKVDGSDNFEVDFDSGDFDDN